MRNGELRIKTVCFTLMRRGRKRAETSPQVGKVLEIKRTEVKPGSKLAAKEQL